MGGQVGWGHLVTAAGSMCTPHWCPSPSGRSTSNRLSPACPEIKYRLDIRSEQCATIHLLSVSDSLLHTYHPAETCMELSWS